MALKKSQASQSLVSAVPTVLIFSTNNELLIINLAGVGGTGELISQQHKAQTLYTIIRPMDAEEYKGLISQKDVPDHTALNVALKVDVSMEEFSLAENLKRILEYFTACNKTIGNEK